MRSADLAVGFLNELGRGDLAGLLVHSTYEYGSEDIWTDVRVPVIELSSPKVFSEAIKGLPEWDQKRIVEAIHSSHEGEQPRDAPDRLLIADSGQEVDDTLYPDICIQRNQLVSVATGGARIQEVDDYYKARQRRIAAALSARGIEDPNPFGSLWDWYHKWKDDFGSYVERRRYINALYAPILETLVEATDVPVPAREPTGWERVDRAVEKARARLKSARHEEDYQTVGLLCRELLISLGQEVYDPEQHVPPDGVTPSRTDGGSMIEAFFGGATQGSSYENVRRHAKAALRLAVELQHRRTADFRAAALCLEATSSVTNIVAILAGRRDQTDEDV